MEVSSWLMHAPLSCRPLLKSDAAEDDVAFCKRLTVEAGVTALPVCIRPYRGFHTLQQRSEQQRQVLRPKLCIYMTCSVMQPSLRRFLRSTPAAIHLGT